MADFRQSRVIINKNRSLLFLVFFLLPFNEPDQRILCRRSVANIDGRLNPDNTTVLGVVHDISSSFLI